MTNHPRLEVPFDEVEKWEKIQGSCARLYAAAEWGYKKGLKEQRSIALRALAEQVVPERLLCTRTAEERTLYHEGRLDAAIRFRAEILTIATELENAQ